MPKITPVASKKTSIASTLAKPKPKIAKPTHASLAVRARMIGRVIPKAAKRGIAHGTALANPAGHRDDIYRRTVKTLGPGARLNAKRFNRNYRKAYDKQDELLSTSTVREFLSGVFETRAKAQLTAAHEQRINDVVNRLSRVRFPTRQSGFALKGARMQHPTNRKLALFADPHATASEHAELDLARKAAAIEAMEEALTDPNWSIESVTEAGLRRAISFTLNEFTAPATASDVAPFVARKNIKEQREQARGRERLKDTFVRLGGTRQSSADDREDREWSSRRGKNRRDVSPTRRIK